MADSWSRLGDAVLGEWLLGSGPAQLTHREPFGAADDEAFGIGVNVGELFGAMDRNDNILETYLAIAHDIPPYITIYQVDETTFTKLANPTTLPLGRGMGCSWSPNGEFLIVSHYTSPYITIYLRDEITFTKLPNPAELPTGNGWGCSWSHNGEFLVMNYAATPWVTIYQRNGTTFTKLANPAILPTGASMRSAWSPNDDFLAVTHEITPWVTIYQRNGTTFTKLANPAILPTGGGRGCDWSRDGTFLAVGHASWPYVTIYQRSGTTFTKLPNPAELPTGSCMGCEWSPNQEFLTLAQAGSPYIIIYQRVGTTFTKLPNPAELPTGTGWGCSWSYNGKFLTIAHATSPYITIYQVDETTFTKLANPALLPTGLGGDCEWATKSYGFLKIVHLKITDSLIVSADAMTFGPRPRETPSVDDRAIVYDGMVARDGLSMSDRAILDMNARLLDTIGIYAEYAFYEDLIRAAIVGRIILYLDIRSDDFCAFVYEAGNSILINGENGRAFVQVQQGVQKFSDEHTVYPGDAVMFSCPTLEPEVGDVVMHDFIAYQIHAQINKFIGGNHIYVKSMLRRDDPHMAMPMVEGLEASYVENTRVWDAEYHGKALLKWMPVNKDVYTSLMYYVVYRARADIGSFLEPAKSIIDDVPAGPELWDNYLVSETPTGLCTGHENQFVRWNGSQWQFFPFTPIPDNPYWVMVEDENDYYIQDEDGTWSPVEFAVLDKTTSNSHADKLLYPEVYAYRVRAVDRYGLVGPLSAVAFARMDFTPPPAPGGLR